MKAESWSIKILHQGRRHTFSLGATVRQDAAIEAKAIYETIVAEGWDSALSTEKNPAGFPKTDPQFWKENLLVRCYRFPAAEEPEKSFAARIGHAGSAYFYRWAPPVRRPPAGWPAGYIAPSSIRAGRWRARCFLAS